MVQQLLDGEGRCDGSLTARDGASAAVMDREHAMGSDGRRDGDSTTMDDKEPMADTYLGRYAAMQKKNAVAAVLDFTDEEWESLKQLNEDDMMRRMTNPSEEGSNNNNGGGLGAENGVNVGEINEEAV
jgi:hypothetical protein